MIFVATRFLHPKKTSLCPTIPLPRKPAARDFVTTPNNHTLRNPHKFNQTWPYLTYGDTTFFQGPPIILGPSSFQGVFFPQNESIGEVNKNPFGFAPKEQLAAPEIQANASAEAKRLGFFGRGDEHLTEVQCLDMLIRFVEGAEPSKMT